MRFWSIVVDEPRTVVVPSIRSRSSEISFIGIIMVGLTMTSSNQGSFSATNPPVVPTKYAKIQRGGRRAVEIYLGTCQVALVVRLLLLVALVAAACHAHGTWHNKRTKE